MVDPYSSCPCGSGKKFRFCCQPIYPAIERAIDQFRGGQHEAALRTMDAAAAANPGHPELLMRKAMLLDAANRREDGERALDEALKLVPNFGPAHFMRARWRHQEGELLGAAILARKAADGYPLEARDHLADVHAFLFEMEMNLNRPLAARAALRMAMRLTPNETNIKDAYENTFG
ncbi:MAG: tetratricopeptide repeat protein, partial [Gemmataceae bacterium]